MGQRKSSTPKKIIKKMRTSPSYREVDSMIVTNCYINNPPLIKIKKEYPDTILPKRANPTDSGLDLSAYKFNFMYNANNEKIELDMTLRSYILKPFERILVDTGISATVGAGFEIQIRPRSGLALKQGLTVVNSPGTVDESYRNHIAVILINLSGIDQEIKVGDRIAQMVVCPVILSLIEEVQELNETNRGLGGFGSTGTN